MLYTQTKVTREPVVVCAKRIMLWFDRLRWPSRIATQDGRAFRKHQSVVIDHSNPTFQPIAAVVVTYDQTATIVPASVGHDPCSLRDEANQPFTVR